MLIVASTIALRCGSSGFVFSLVFLVADDVKYSDHQSAGRCMRED